MYYSYNSIIKFIGFEPIYYVINLCIVLLQICICVFINVLLISIIKLFNFKKS